MVLGLSTSVVAVLLYEPNYALVADHLGAE